MKTIALALVLGLVALSGTAEARILRRHCGVVRHVERHCGKGGCGTHRVRHVERHVGCGAGACGAGVCK